MPNNTIDDLRTHLFETLAALKDEETPMDLDRARAIASVGKVIVESAKVEVDFLKVTGVERSTGFLPESTKPAAPERPRLDKRTETIAAAGDKCVLCHCRLTLPYNIERGLCASCAERPEAKNVRKRA